MDCRCRRSRAGIVTDVGAVSPHVLHSTRSRDGRAHSESTGRGWYLRMDARCARPLRRVHVWLVLLDQPDPLLREHPVLPRRTRGRSIRGGCKGSGDLHLRFDRGVTARDRRPAWRTQVRKVASEYRHDRRVDRCADDHRDGDRDLRTRTGSDVILAGVLHSTAQFRHGSPLGNDGVCILRHRIHRTGPQRN